MGSILPYTAALQKSINIDYMELFQTVVLILAIPLFLGIWVSQKFPKLVKIISKPIRIISFIILVGIISLAFSNNFSLFIEYFDYLFFIVLLHNFVALITGFVFAKLTRNNAADVRSITIETSIQNSALGLIIIFTFSGAMVPWPS